MYPNFEILKGLRVKFQDYEISSGYQIFVRPFVLHPWTTQLARYENVYNNT